MTPAIYLKIISLVLLLLTTASSFALTGKRIGIVYSETSANRFYDKFSYSQLFMAMQHQAMMAGIPYDLLTEDDLTRIDKLSTYGALLIPNMQYVTASKLSVIENTLNQAVFSHGLGLIVAGNLMTHSENGDPLPGDPYSRMKQWLGISYAASASNVAMQIRANDTRHRIMKDYLTNELILNYKQIWFDSFQAVAGQSASLLATLQVGEQIYNGVLATQTGGRNVHFANDQVLADTKLVWPALQWVMYGEQVSVGLKLSRQNSIFIARNDMDLSMFADTLQFTEIPLYDLLADWKTSFNFVGSYYLNIGNDPSSSEYTDWNISAPLYRDYIALGNEIGTHSWTHPDMTSLLSKAELEFEFNQSRIEIGNQLGIKVQGAAIPGNPESLEVDQQLEQYFAYLSGRSGTIGSGYPSAIGRLRPDSSMIYFSLNLSPDFTLIDYLGYNTSEAESIWKNEYAALLRHASQPIIHWLWHDYGPTIEAGNKYSVAMYTNLISMAHAKGSEFVTLADLKDRIITHEKAALTVTGTDPVTASVKAHGVGQFSLMVHSDQPISQVTNWYAYDDDQVFLPDEGGKFIIHMGTDQVNVTRITSLPMRARLLTLNGDGTGLSFSFEGEGSVSVHLNSAIVNNLAVDGSDDFTLNGNQLTLNFNQFGLHTVDLRQTVISNPVSGLNVDGDLSDWDRLTSFGPDQNDVSGTNNLIDWLESWIAHDDTHMYLAIRNDGPISLSWGHNLYLDTDNNTMTGFNHDGSYPIGADYLIQGGYLFQYTGNGSNWNWEYIGALTTAVNAHQAEFSLPRAWIANPASLQLFFLGENRAYDGGSTEDYYPDDVTNSSNNVRYFNYSF